MSGVLSALAASGGLRRSLGALVHDGTVSRLLTSTQSTGCLPWGIGESDDGPSCSGRRPFPQQLLLQRLLTTQSASGGDNPLPPHSSSPTPSPPRPNLLMRNLPAGLVPYAQLMRLDKPIGTWLLALPCFWSIGLATPPGHLPDLYMLTLFGVGAVLLRGAGCTVNDLWDRDLDSRVERTRTRPLAAGTLTPRQAVGLLALQLSLGLIILLQLNDYSKILGASSLLLVGTYPLMKRITFWPQAFLGLTINWGALMGYAAVVGSCDWAVVLPLYLAGLNWTLVYDTIYAHQDKRDDEVVGVKSTARLFAERSKTWFTGFAAAQVACLAAAGAAAGCGMPYYAGVAGVAAHLAWQIRTVDLDNGPDCMAKFVSNKWCGGLLFGAIVLDRLLAG